MAGFPSLKTMEAFDFKFPSDMPKKQIQQLDCPSFEHFPNRGVDMEIEKIFRKSLSLHSLLKRRGS